MKRSIRILLALLLLVEAAAACPTCRTALSDGGARWAQGFSLSIAVLLGVLLLAAGSFGLALWRATRIPG